MELLQTKHRVRDGYAGMIVATGFVRDQCSDKAGELWRSRHGGTSLRSGARPLTTATATENGPGAAGAGRNSISDAEQLLTILYPATAIESLKVDSVDETADDVLDYLRSLGNALGHPASADQVHQRLHAHLPGRRDAGLLRGQLLRVRRTTEAATIKPEQRKLHVVDSYSMSVTLCLATLGFLRVYRRGHCRSQRMLQEVDELEKLSSQRLTAAMVGLLRSFTVNTFDPTDPPGQAMCTMINQGGVATEILVRDLLEELAEVRAGLRQELTIGTRPGGRRAGEPGAAVRMRLVLGRRRRGARGSLCDRYRPAAGGRRRGAALPVLHRRRPRRHPGPVQRADPDSRPAERGAAAAGPRAAAALGPDPAVLGQDRHLRRRPVAARRPAVDDHRRPRVRLLLGTAHLDRHRGRGQRADRERRRRADRAGARRACQPRADHPQADGGRPGDRPAHAGHAAAADRQREGGRGPRLQWTVSSFTSLVLKRLLRVAELLDDKVRPGPLPRSRRPDLGAHRAPPDSRRRRRAACGTSRRRYSPARRSPLTAGRPGTTPNASSRCWSPPPT